MPDKKPDEFDTIRENYRANYHLTTIAWTTAMLLMVVGLGFFLFGRYFSAYVCFAGVVALAVVAIKEPKLIRRKWWDKVEPRNFE